MNPTVSIVLYYREDRGWLKDAIQSVKNQRYNGKIELIEETGGTASENLNRGIKRATGKYLRYLSEDDLLPQYSIHQSVLKLEESECDFLHGNAVNFFGYPVIYPEGHISFSGRTDKQVPRILFPDLNDLIKRNEIHGGTVMYRTELLQAFEKPFDEGLTCAEEYDLNMKLLKQGATIDFVNAFVYFYRRHKQQKSLGVNADQVKRAEIINGIKKRYV